MQISRAHRGTERDITQNNNRVRGSKPIFAQYVNWRVVEEVCNRVIYLNASECESDVLEGTHGKEEQYIKILPRVHHLQSRCPNKT